MEKNEYLFRAGFIYSNVVVVMYVSFKGISHITLYKLMSRKGRGKTVCKAKHDPSKHLRLH